MPVLEGKRMTIMLSPKKSVSSKAAAAKQQAAAVQKAAKNADDTQPTESADSDEEE